MIIHDYVRTNDIPGLASCLAGGGDVHLPAGRMGRTPLIVAVIDPSVTPETVRFLLQNGADVTAKTVPNYPEDEPEGVLRLAVRAGDTAKVALLLDAGADLHYRDRSHKLEDSDDTVLLEAFGGKDLVCNPRVMSLLRLLLERGAVPNANDLQGGGALTTASYLGRFDAEQLLIAAGSLRNELEWTPLHTAVALGSPNDVERELVSGADLSARDPWDRTPWLLSIQSGDIAKAKLLMSAGADTTVESIWRHTSFKYALAGDHGAMLAWLLERGLVTELADQSGITALRLAVVANAVACTRVLLERLFSGKVLAMPPRPLMEEAVSLEMVRLLEWYGESLSDMSDELRALPTGRVWEENADVEVVEADYRAAPTREFGTTNPQLMNFPFWQAMVRSGAIAYRPRQRYGDTKSFRGPPVWSHKRFGKSFTELPDGRFIEIGGEHEDGSDPDFCIYNDVVVHHSAGQFDIYGYPEDVFPPTDFHSATYADGFIYIIGCLGHPEQRVPGVTPAYRLDCSTFRMERLKTTGKNPGWIYRHKAHFADGDIVVSDGQILSKRGREFKKNVATYVLNLKSLRWRRVGS